MVDLMTDLIADLQKITLDVLRIEAPVGFLKPHTNLYELGLDSLNIVELLTEIETTFHLTIDVEDLDATLFNQFGNLVAFVQSKIATRS